MSYDTHKTWLYRLEGRNIHLYQYIDGVSTDTLAGIRIALPSEYYGKQLGVDFSGLLYNKKDSKTLSKQEAFRVYRYAYEHRNNCKVSA